MRPDVYFFPGNARRQQPFVTGHRCDCAPPRNRLREFEPTDRVFGERSAGLEKRLRKELCAAKTLKGISDSPHVIDESCAERERESTPFSWARSCDSFVTKPPPPALLTHPKGRGFNRLRRHSARLSLKET